MRVRRIVIFGLSGYTMFFHFVSNMPRFSNRVTEYKMCFFIFSTTFVWRISLSKKNWGPYDQKCILVSMWGTGYSCPSETSLFSTFFAKYSCKKFHKNPSDGSWVFSCGQTDRQTDVTKLLVIVAFPQFLERV